MCFLWVFSWLNLYYFTLAYTSEVTFALTDACLYVYCRLYSYLMIKKRSTWMKSLNRQNDRPTNTNVTSLKAASCSRLWSSGLKQSSRSQRWTSGCEILITSLTALSLSQVGFPTFERTVDQPFVAPGARSTLAPSVRSTLPLSSDCSTRSASISAHAAVYHKLSQQNSSHAHLQCVVWRWEGSAWQWGGSSSATSSSWTHQFLHKNNLHY